jgi:phenylpyruvate tautomerase PptA (4-oxalocrotonate tautomerase family)
MNKIAVIAAVTIVAGCAVEPTIQTGPNAETTFDGLVRVDNARFAGAWVDPDVDLKQYTKIIPGGAEFEFRNVQKMSASAARRSNENEFWISDTNKQRLIDTVTEVFTEELQKSESFTVTDEPAPDALIIIGGLHDIVSQVPPEDVGRSEVWLRSVGEATLVIELRDSLSNEVVYRAVERRAAENVGNQMIRANTATTWAEVRRWARRWAVRLREGLDSVHE